MSVFPRFVDWNSQSVEEPLKGESKRSENAKSDSVSEEDSKWIAYYDKAEAKKQGNLWRAAEKKKPWYDAPAKVKQNKSRKILMKDGPSEVVRLEKALTWEFLGWSGAFPFTLIADENQKIFTAKYNKEKMMFMKVFKGSWKIEPLYVDSERLCKEREPKSREEYKRCSRGQGKVASKVTMDQYFQPYFPLNLPPISWFIRWITIKTTKKLLKLIQDASIMYRDTSPTEL
ncbi:hypothetical protein CARUB_v10011421mg [Capsella rubella]|uniref:DUF220 domain-containing protein n=1 Tax=Capsella rubella TaxID=81985 RepID=R0ILC4_9BRAS|nr:hypothetical protein CARUB_v10011421mg [Capsella rubella]